MRTHARIVYATADTCFGRLLVARTDRGLCAILFGSDDTSLRADLEQRFPNAEVSHAETATDVTANIVGCIERGDELAAGIALDTDGTLFQEIVWSAIRAIPSGETASYMELAQRIGRPRAARAVARACAENRLAVIVPCHRVVRTDGGVSGYRWGVERKQALLSRERWQPADHPQMMTGTASRTAMP
ncbi:MAG: methylated-DNA--[protein]-cysteine S-methyltransferase [Longimicrobiales bacterium]